METYCQIATDLEDELSGLGEISENFPEQIEYATGRCKLAVDRLHKRVLQTGFPDKESEIIFFKKIKPSVCSKLIFYQAVFEIESARLKIDAKGLKKYFQKELKKVLKYMKKHEVKVQYHRCDHSYLDEKYFLRDNNEIPLEVKDSHAVMDENFFTWKDHTFSTIMASEMLIAYIRNEMEKLDNPSGQILPRSKATWTGNKIDLQELSYALYLDGSVNHGKATIIDITRALELAFNVELEKDIYKTQKQLMERANPVKYLTHLAEMLRRRIFNKLE